MNDINNNDNRNDSKNGYHVIIITMTMITIIRTVITQL